MIDVKREIKIMNPLRNYNILMLSKSIELAVYFSKV